LPNGLETLECGYNQLTTVSSLPPNLNILG
jgi:hypothetical protein